jgi:PAS domain S-box-containing protein
LKLLGDADLATGEHVLGGLSAQLGHIVCDPQLLILEVDLTARRILTRRRDQLVGQPFLRYLEEDAVPELDSMARQLVVEGLGSARVQTRVLAERRGPASVTITMTYLPGVSARTATDEGTIVLTLELLPRSEVDPTASDSGAGDLGDRSADLITRYRLWPEPGFDYVSPSAEEVLGYPARAFYADPWLLHELIEDPAEVEQLHRIYEGEERREPLLLRVVGRNGNVIALEHRFTGVRDGQGRLLAVEAIARDVTDRVEEQDRHTTAVAATRLFRELAPNDLDVADPDSVVKAAVEAVCRHLDWPVGHALLIAETPDHLVSAAWHDPEPTRSAPLRACTDAGPMPIEADLVADAVSMMEQVVHDLEDGRTNRAIVAARCGYRHAVILPVPVDGSVGAVLEFFTDGRRRPSAAIVAGVADFVDDVGRSLQRNQAVVRLLDRDQARQEFVTRAAHELRGPIGAVSLMASALARKAETSGDTSTASALNALAAQAERIGSMATRLLELTQLEDGRLDLRPERVSVATAVRTAIVALPVSDGIGVEIAVPPELRVLADPSLVDSILSNLLANAVRYASSTVQVEASQLDGAVRLCVRDDGPGVPESLVSHLFQPITSTLATAEHGGIGLALVGRMATAMSGEVRYDGDARGALFVVTLPSADEDVEEIIELV